MNTNTQKKFLWFIIPFFMGYAYWMTCAFIQIDQYRSKTVTSLHTFNQEQYEEELLESEAMEFLTEQGEYDELVSFNDNGYGYTHIINFDNIVYSL